MVRKLGWLLEVVVFGPAGDIDELEDFVRSYAEELLDVFFDVQALSCSSLPHSLVRYTLFLEVGSRFVRSLGGDVDEYFELIVVRHRDGRVRCVVDDVVYDREGKRIDVERRIAVAEIRIRSRDEPGTEIVFVRGETS